MTEPHDSKKKVEETTTAQTRALKVGVAADLITLIGSCEGDRILHAPLTQQRGCELAN